MRANPRVLRARKTTEPDVPPRSMAEEVYEEIKRKIITLHYGPGQYLNESTICGELKAGRTPVHHAIHRLQLEGLVEIIPRKGIIVRPDSLNEMLDLLEARALTEPHCAGLAAERASPAQLEELERLLAGGRSHLSSRSIMQFMQNDRMFHCMVTRLSGNVVLNEMLPLLHDRSGRIWHLHGWSDQDFMRTQSEHEEILEGIKARDKDRASRGMQRHLSSLRQWLLSR